MNARDLILWRKTIEKLEAGAPERLTVDERELVAFYGGADIMLRKAVAGTPPRAEPGPLLTKALGSEGAHPTHFKTEADFLAWFARLMKARHP